MEQLPVFLNLRGRTVVLVGEGEAADAKARLIARAGGRVVPEWQDGATIAFVALDD
ncbi:MAG TPA: NAD(P)-dependent oxidoreductase, partial [Sphingopyxis sp.]|nr:NAD(P)-dependent oxidoreductase [Sphingopyxis sp.]